MISRATTAWVTINPIAQSLFNLLTLLIVHLLPAAAQLLALVTRQVTKILSQFTQPLLFFRRQLLEPTIVFAHLLALGFRHVAPAF